MNIESNNQADKPQKKSFVEKQKEKVAYGMVQSATSEISQSWYEKYSCGMQYFLLTLGL